MARYKTLLKLSKSSQLWHHLSLPPHTAAGADEEKEVKKDVGGSEADHDQGPDNRVLPDGVETPLQRTRLINVPTKQVF